MIYVRQKSVSRRSRWNGINQPIRVRTFWAMTYGGTIRIQKLVLHLAILYFHFVEAEILNAHFKSTYWRALKDKI